MKRRTFAATCLFAVGSWVLSTAPLEAEDPQIDATIGVEAKLSENSSTRELITAAATTEAFSIAAALSVNADAKYGPDIAYLRQSGSFFNQYFLMEEGYTTLALGTLRWTGGRFRQVEDYQSPYSLFLNGEGVASQGMLLRWENRFFTYESRWIELNANSRFPNASETPKAWQARQGFPDRGANLKTFLFRVGNMRLGLQDAGVYTKRSFDLEYFLSPMPEYFTQYVKGTAGRPWTTGSNENNILGFFWDWKEPEFSVGFQFLADDFNLNFLSNEIFPNNPWKAAWSLGGEWITSEGTWGFHHAGALKYTFEPITTQPGGEEGSAYGYTRYPDVEYFAGNGFRALTVQDNALGYKHGENNAAWTVTYHRTWGSEWNLSASAEFVLAGNNSPANPWQDGTGGDQSDLGTHWLDDPVLQKTFVVEGAVVWTLPSWTFSARLELGYIWNVLELTAPRSGELDETLSSLDRFVKIYRPSERHEPVAALVLGATWHWDLTELLQ